MICEWAPAHDVYTGKPETAIRAFVEIPLSVRKVLIERTKKATDYDDVVTIFRDSISGNSLYESEITSMHFGSKGRMCKTVSRIKWRDSDTQQALVFCEQGYCVIRPSVCNNWAIIRRLAEPPRTPPIAATPEDGDSPADPVQLLSVPSGSNETPIATFETGTGSAPFAPSASLTDWFYGPVAVYPTPSLPAVPVPAIPEPAPLWLLLAGSVAIALWRYKTKEK